MSINVVEEFLELVKITSLSKKEGKLAAYLKTKLNNYKLSVIEDNSARHTGSDTGNLIAVFPGDKKKAKILLAAHMDTVSQKEGMIPQIREGIIYSDGETILGADDKAGIAIILGVLDRLHENPSISHGDIEMLFTVQEEVGLIGIKNLDYPLTADYGYVLDADGPVGTIVNASPSHNTVDIVVEGKAAHAGVEPEMGINAIVVAAEAIAAVPSGRIDHETTSNFGIISGGRGRNIVADRVEITAEVRSRDKQKLQVETEKLMNQFKETTDKYKAKLHIKKELAYEAFTIDPKQEVIATAIKAGKRLGVDVILKTTGGGLDANILNAKGIPCVALGLGNGAAHMNEEYQNISEMEKAVEFIIEILKES